MNQPATQTEGQGVNPAMLRILDTTRIIVEPPPARDGGAWADENRILPPGSPEPGPWRTDRVPYTKPIYEACASGLYSQVNIAMGAQMSKTETELNIIGHRFDDGPYAPALVIGPTEKWARSFGADRLNKMLRTTPSLWSKVEKGHADKVLEKYIGGIRLGIGWAGSATELASHPAGLVLIDERDRMGNDVDGEGDPVEMARARTKNYRNSLLCVVSTPTVEGASPIWTLWEEGTMGKWAWPCPDCHQHFVPTLKLLNWQEAKTKAEARANARLVCPNCGTMIHSRHKDSMNAQGRYHYHTRDADGNEIPTGTEPPPNDSASFWVSGLCSPWVTFEEMAERLFDAYRSRDPDRIQAVVNTMGGELFRTEGEAPDWDEAAALRRHYQPRTRPEGVQMITMGVDVQKRGLYFVVRGWGFNSESWLLEEGYLAGETAFDDVWLMLARQAAVTYRDMNIARLFVDSGYRPGDKWRRPENQVYEFCKRHPGFAFPTKGHDTQDRPLRPSMIDVNSAGKVLKGGLQLWHLHTDHLKSWIHSRIRWPDHQPGGFHLHSDTTEDYCKQITAEQVLVKSSGKRVWVKIREDNHYLDCEVNALAAAKTLQVEALRPMEEVIARREAEDQAAAERMVNPHTPKPAPGGLRQGRQSSWMRR